jgi:FkbM family methyltransferase
MTPPAVVDVGTGNVPYLEWFDWIPRRISIDIDVPYRSDAVEGVQGDIHQLAFEAPFDICTCLQVLEHVSEPEPFARRLLDLGKLVLVSVPYKWPEGTSAEHVNDPVDLEKVTAWFGRKPNYHLVVREPFSGNKGARLFALFDVADPARRFRSEMASLRRPREEDQEARALRREHRKYRRTRSSLGWERLSRLVPGPDLIVDVGASNGTPGLYRAFPDCKFVLIDALDGNRASMETFAKDYDCSIIISGVGADAGTLTLNVAGNEAGSRSSFMQRRGAFEDEDATPREIAVARLDDLVAPGSDSIGLKIDVEGFEREVLKGAERLMPQIQWIVAEVSMAPRFEHDPLFHGIYDLLRENGFLFRDIVEIRRNRGGDLRLIDALFVREPWIEYPWRSAEPPVG